jgi:outer membrane receptor protein involved in Fe transport
MMKKVFMFVVALSLALLATSAFAQTTTTGSIEGLVTDPNGAAVKGASVTATSPNMISTKTATTGDDGRYQMGNLPPGKYKVTIDAGGFAKWASAEFEVNLGRTSTADASLQLATATATVQVTGGAVVDAAQNTTGSNVSTDQFSNFPTQRTVQGLYNIAPTVTRSGLRDAAGRDRDPSVAGSSGPENNYILDGVNTTDPAFGGSGANLPFEFVQEVEIKTGAYGAEYGKATGGIFNVVTKSGGNEFHGDLFGYGTTKGLVREVKNFPFTGAAANGFSETDLGGDIGGPIKKDKLWFFGAFNPQRRKNFYLTQTFHNDAENKVTIPFYAGKVTWAVNTKNTLTLSTFGDFTKIQGFLATGALANVSGFGSDINAFQGTQETGGHNYTARLNSTIRNNFIAEITGGLHFQRANTIPVAVDQPLITDNFAVVRNGVTLPVTASGLSSGSTNTGFLDYVDGRNGSLQRSYLRGPGFGLFGNQDRDRYEINAHMQNIEGKHAIKWGFEWFRVKYNISTLSSGPAVTYANPLNVATSNLPSGAVATNGVRITNNFLVCTVRGTVVVCPNTTAAARLTGGATSDFPTNGTTVTTNRLAGIGITAVQLNPITAAEFNTNPFLVRSTTRVRDFELNANTYTNAEAFYIQDDYKFARDFQFNIGVRWDYEQAYNADGGTYIKFNNFWDNLAPRLGLVWDFTHKGKGKLYANYATFIESPIPLDVNVRAAGGNSQTDKNFNVNTLNAPSSATIATGFTPVNLGADATPLDPGLKPPSIGEYTMGLEYEVMKDLALGFRGVYRHERNVVEDGSFDDGTTYFIFNPGRNEPGTTERAACEGDIASGRIPRCFGRAQRFYRAFEVTATKRFTNHWQMITSYVYSSLTGNYEGLFRNDNGQSDPNITSLFDLQSLLDNTYGRLPNDRPHQFKFNGSYQFPFRLMLSGNFYWQTGTPFNQLIPHPIYGNNEGFAVQRGTAIVPSVAASQAGFPNTVDSIGSNRTPSTMNLDLGIYYPIKLGEKKELRLSGDWFNVFNQQRAVTLDQTFSINSGASGVAPVLNPFYGAALLVQAPSAFRFGAKFTF